jgi:hypothetical protein
MDSKVLYTAAITLAGSALFQLVGSSSAVQNFMLVMVFAMLYAFTAEE